jgi:hypothetical protein
MMFPCTPKGQHRNVWTGQITYLVQNKSYVNSLAESLMARKRPN